MLFNSYLFILLFLPSTLFTFFILGKNKKYQLGLFWLVLASLFFYAWWSPTCLLLMLASLFINYLVGIKIKLEKKQSTIAAKTWLVLGIIFNLSLIIFYKYTNFFIDCINAGFGQELSKFNIILPLAISFFTFQQIAYLVDIYQNKAEVPSLLQYFLFVTFFPQLIAGPIVHHHELIPQFENKKIFNLNKKNIAIGLTIFCIGLFKKVGIADSIAPIANQVFHLAKIGTIPTFWEAWCGALTYAFQLYFDFSGYSDMAIGLARLFGIVLPINFNSPYKATNIIDFWRRWHITLSRFLRDYLYIPLGGSKKGAFNRYQNLMITMLLGGLWHGAGLNFLLWGGLHGIYLVINHLWQKMIYCFLPFSVVKSLIYKWSCHLITFLCVVWAWVLFRAENFDDAKRMYQAMSGLNGIQLPFRLAKYSETYWLQKLEPLVVFEGMFNHQLFESIQTIMILFVLLGITLLFPNTVSFMKGYSPALDFNKKYQASLFNISWKPTMLWALFAGALTIICLTLLSQPSEFLYYQF